MSYYSKMLNFTIVRILLILVSLNIIYQTLLEINNSIVIDIFALESSFNNTNNTISDLKPLKNEQIIIPNWRITEDKIKNDENFKIISIAQKNIKIIEPKKYYSTTIYINTSDIILSQIKNVTYNFHPTFNPNKVTIDQHQNKFAYNFIASGVFTISAEIQFFNESKKTIISKITPGLDYIFPFHIDDPIIEGNNIILNGKTANSVSKMQVDWGDGNIYNGTFPLSHTYQEPRLYTIKITTFDNQNNISSSKSIQTSSFALQDLFKNEPSIDIDTKTNILLKLDEIPTEFTEEQIYLPIKGTLNHINKTGISNIKMIVEIKNNNDNNGSPKRFTSDPTDGNGNFEAELNNFELTNGKYNLSVKPSDVYYSKLLASRTITVLPSSLSVNELITIVGGILAIGAGVIGGIIKIPNYLINKKQKENLYNYLKMIIYDLEDKYTDKEKFLTSLKYRRLEILEEFKKGTVTLEQYLILDNRISELEDTFNHNKKP